MSMLKKIVVLAVTTGLAKKAWDKYSEKNPQAAGRARAKLRESTDWAKSSLKENSDKAKAAIKESTDRAMSSVNREEKSS